MMGANPVMEHSMQLSHKMKQSFSKLSDADLSLLSNGKHDKFILKLQELYGLSRDEAEIRVSAIQKNAEMQMACMAPGM